MNKNPLILFVKNKIVACLFVRFFALFKMRVGKIQRIAFTAGPAKAVRIVCKAV